jgi:hypothetical protein
MATTTSILSDTIMAQAKAFKEARSRFDEQFMDWSRGIPPLAPEHFWPMVDEFRKVVVDTSRYGTGPVGEAAANEFIRLAAVNGGDIAAAVHFALSWRHYTRRASACGDKCEFDWMRGDDSYGDLMDALPLAGQRVNETLGLGKFDSLNHFNKEVGNACEWAAEGEDRSRLKKMVLSGESYFASSLEEAAQKWVVIESRNYGKGGE